MSRIECKSGLPVCKGKLFPCARCKDRYCEDCVNVRSALVECETCKKLFCKNCRETCRCTGDTFCEACYIIHNINEHYVKIQCEFCPNNPKFSLIEYNQHIVKEHKKIICHCGDEIEGTNNISNHLEQSKKHTFCECKCGQGYEAYREEEHKKGFVHRITNCPLCNEEIENYLLKDHIIESHKTICPICKEKVNGSELQTHYEQCEKTNGKLYTCKHEECKYMIKNINFENAQLLMNLHEKYFCRFTDISKYPENFYVCPFNDVGCQFTISEDIDILKRREKIAIHLRDTCEFMYVGCKYVCSRYFPRNKIKQHEEICENINICRFCNKSIANFKDHIQNDCEKTICKYHTNGCKYYSTDGNILKKHEENCPKKQTICLFCLKEFENIDCLDRHLIFECQANKCPSCHKIFRSLKPFLDNISN